MKGRHRFRRLWRASSRRAYCFLLQPQFVYPEVGRNQARLLRGIGLVSVRDYWDGDKKKPIDMNRVKIIAKSIPTENKIQRLDRQVSRKPEPWAKTSTR
jgi:hypothetical protein